MLYIAIGALIVSVIMNIISIYYNQKSISRLWECYFEVEKNADFIPTLKKILGYKAHTKDEDGYHMYDQLTRLNALYDHLGIEYKDEPKGFVKK